MFSRRCFLKKKLKKRQNTDLQNGAETSKPHNIEVGGRGNDVLYSYKLDKMDKLINDEYSLSYILYNNRIIENNYTVYLR